MDWITRTAETQLMTLLKEFPAVAVIGARQTGKSALLFHELPTAACFRLDELVTRELLADDRGLLYRPTGTLILDEIQKMPALLEELKVLIDTHRQRRGQFALTGSEQFQLMRGLQESLAGRLALLDLYPLSWQELEAAGRVQRAREDLSLFIVRGGYPELWMEEAADAGRSYRWCSAYLSTYIERDVCAHFGIQHASQFLKFLRLVALRAGQLLNLTELARDAGVSVPTTREWLSILERSMIIRLVQPFHANLAKRLVKMPKLYFLDTGLLCYLVGLDSVTGLERHPLRGAIHENAVFAELLKRTSTMWGATSITFYRTHDGQEVDFVIERGLTCVGIEVKRSGTASAADMKGLRFLLEEGLLQRGVVMTLQAESHPMAPGIDAVPFWDWSILEPLTASF